MKLSQFKFKLPEEQIALYPHSIVHEFTNDDGTKGEFRITRRDECRLMVLHRKSQAIDMYKRDEEGKPIEGADLDFRNVLDYFDEGDTFVFNDTKVFPARLYGTKEKTDAKIEVFLLRELNEEMRLWDVLVEPARKIRIGNKLFFDESGTMVAEVIDNTTSRGRTLRFLYDCPHDEFKRELFALGEAPLPRYIIDRRENPHGTAEDLDDFQCIFAKNEGGVTVPASGLHFSRELMKRMEIKGIEKAFITLHCGLGTFHDIEVEDLTKHKMDSEQMFVTQEACDIVNGAKRSGKHVCAVGTSGESYRDSRGNRWYAQGLRGLDKQVHIPALRLRPCRLDDCQLLPPVLHLADGDRCIWRLRTGDGSIRHGCQERIHVRLLRRCHAYPQ